MNPTARCILGRLMAIIAGLGLVIWLFWIFGSVAGVLPADFLGIRGPIGIGLALFGTPILSTILMGVSARLTMGEAQKKGNTNRPVTKVKSSWYAFGQFLQILAGVWFLSAFLAMFLTERYASLHPFVWWTFAIWMGTFAAGIVGLAVIGPGIYAAKALYQIVHDPLASKLETRLEWIWCASGGLFLSLLLGAATALTVFGPFADVKVWFISVCWLLLMAPWVMLGIVARGIVRHFAAYRQEEVEQGHYETASDAAQIRVEQATRRV
jgi:hypothetical protein